MPSAQNQIQIVDTHETSETLAITRLQRVGYQINRTLLGETSYGPSFRGWLQQEKHRQYGITEFHPLRGMTAPELTTVLRQHHAAGAQFLSFFMDTPAHEQNGEGLNLFSFSPRNTQHASHVLFESLRQTLQAQPAN